MSGLWAVIPIKRFTEAKTRLKGSVSAPGRAALARACSNHVLTTVLDCDLFSGVLVLTNDSAVEHWSRGLGALVLRDGAGKTLAQTVECGLVQIKAWGGDSAVMIMGDLPFLNAASLGMVVHKVGSTGCVIGPDRRREGTNVLGLGSLERTGVYFGEPKSFSLHLQARVRESLPFEIVESPETGFDVDLPEDYAVLRSAEEDVTGGGFGVGLAGWGTRISGLCPG